MTDMLFVRDFAGFAGGHLKFIDYLQHTKQSGIISPALYQTPRSRSVAGNIFGKFNEISISQLRAFPAYFVAGDDWFILDDAGLDTSKSKVVNLIQGFRHVVPNNPLFSYLRRPAIRICVSPAVAEAIRDHANGEIYIVENGVEVRGISCSYPLDAPARFMIAGLKNPEIAREVAIRLRDYPVDVITNLIPRQEFLARMAAASICILLPLPQEGFFLPPLEAMALARGVVTPDCCGNLCYCKPDENCVMPDYEAGALADGALALARDRRRLARMAEAALTTANSRSMQYERSTYVKILESHFVCRQ
jgi:glycosyltransferase involved in cell wall biosynthesis